MGREPWNPSLDLKRLLANHSEILQREEAFRSALVEIVEGYRLGHYPDSIRYAERILSRFPQ
jgi:hypothetical protein